MEYAYWGNVVARTETLSRTAGENIFADVGVLLASYWEQFIT